MFDFLNNVLFFIIAIGVLVTFHEFGHYFVARKLGVKVLRFSIGFGKPFYTHNRQVGEDKIEFVLATIPLGGYVKMLDEREGPVEPELRSRAFNNQTLGKRAAIVFAGPFFNFLLAIGLYWFVFVYGVVDIKPVLNQPEVGTIAEKAGFQAEDEIIAVNDEPIQTMTAFRLALIDHAIDGGDVVIRVIDKSQSERQRILHIGDRHILKEEGDAVDKLGFKIWNPTIPADIGGTVEGGAAEKAGMQTDDRIIAVNQEVVESWEQVVKLISSNPGQALDLTVLRNDQELTMTVTPAVRQNEKGEDEGYIGVYLKRPDWLYNRLRTEVVYSPLPAVVEALEKTWTMSILTLRVLGKMVMGEAALENISGPITIAQYAGISAKIGLVQFLSFMAIISISLGVLNLLPVPVLDGGHLLYYLLEFIKGSPLSEQAEIMGQKIGMTLLFLLMTIAIFNDIQRLFS